MTILQVADTLEIKKTNVENYYRAARKRLTAKLEESLNDHVQRYCPPEDMDDEFQNEWNKMADFLEKNGGLEKAITDVHKNTTPKHSQTMTNLVNRLTQMHSKLPDPLNDQP